MPDEFEWKVVKSGTSDPAFSPSGFTSYRETDTAEITSYMIEDGGYFSANKTDSPYEVEVELVKTGEPREIGLFMEGLRKWRRSLDLVDVVMPHGVLMRANVVEVISEMGRDTGPRLVRPRIRMQEVRFQKASVETVPFPFAEAQVKDQETTTTTKSGMKAGYSESEVKAAQIRKQVAADG